MSLSRISENFEVDTFDNNVPTIGEYFANRSIFITGATGFMGKVLVEKLLRSCPKIRTIYIILREKRGVSVEERWKKITEIELFSNLKTLQPGVLQTKVKVMNGDCQLEKLGLSEEDRREIEDNVSIIYHVAASVRFDDPLKKAVLLNTRGTREVMHLAHRTKNLSVVMHVSTAYCHTDKPEVHERMYPAHADWKQTIQLFESCDEKTLDVLSRKIIDPMANTYTYSKSLAEHVVNDMANGSFPCVLFRPSVVVSAEEDPLPGWIDNFNGPMGLLVACGKGILRSGRISPTAKLDLIPVDKLIKSMVIATWKKAVQSEERRKELTVINACSNDQILKMTMYEIIETGKHISHRIPFNNIFWYPGGILTNCSYWGYINVCLLQLLPALILEPLLRLAKSKISLLAIQRKIMTAFMAVDFFLSFQWKFHNEAFMALDSSLKKEDKEAWTFLTGVADTKEYLTKGIYGLRQFLLKEDISTLKHAKIHSNRMYWVDKFTKISLSAVIIHYIALWTKSNVGHYLQI